MLTLRDAPDDGNDNDDDEEEEEAEEEAEDDDEDDTDDDAATAAMAASCAAVFAFRCCRSNRRSASCKSFLHSCCSAGDATTVIPVCKFEFPGDGESGRCDRRTAVRKLATANLASDRHVAAEADNMSQLHQQ